jgi:dienelactone hydrolase
LTHNRTLGTPTSRRRLAPRCVAFDALRRGVKPLLTCTALAVVIAAAFGCALADAAEGSLPGTQPLTAQGDLSTQMAQGISRFLEHETTASVESRGRFWKPDTSSAVAYSKSLQPNRDRLARIIGAVDPRSTNPEMELVGSVTVSSRVAETDRFMAYAVRWRVFEGVYGEGLLLQPKGGVVARVIALPDADQAPEAIAGLAPGVEAPFQYARRLAENGVQVVIPTLADRTDTFSASEIAKRSTNLPHREWIYRPAYMLGRHIIGYEVQKVRSAIDWLVAQNSSERVGIGVIGWGEGGLIALHSAAVDVRVDSTVVSGYFSKREQLWREPIYRNVFGLLTEFGDAEIAALVAPRSLIIEQADAPAVSGPPAAREGRRNAAAPGRISTPDAADLRAEVDRVRKLTGTFASFIQLQSPSGSAGTSFLPLGERTVSAFLQSLTGRNSALQSVGSEPRELRSKFDPRERQRRVVQEMERHTQRLLQLAGTRREESFWSKLTPTTPERWREAMRPYREQLGNEVLGRFQTSGLPWNARSRRLQENATWTAHEVMLDVLPDVFAWGYLLLPKGMKPGERRPVVIAQHGLNSTHADVINADPNSKFYHQFKGFGVQLVERGFIVFAPRNPYRGDDLFRSLQRQANPLGKSLFSIIVAQHERILDWLVTQPFVDVARIGFYGLSYGGKTAMRVPALLDRYAVVVCSGDFNEWIWKNATTDSERSYLFTNEYEMPEFNLGMTFSYAEMAAMIAPRPFMVERGHDDTVGLDEWVAFEYAKVNRLYAKLKIPERTEIEYFVGPHTINGVGTFKFLHRHLNWPEPAGSR